MQAVHTVEEEQVEHAVIRLLQAVQIELFGAYCEVQLRHTLVDEHVRQFDREVTQVWHWLLEFKAYPETHTQLEPERTKFCPLTQAVHVDRLLQDVQAIMSELQVEHVLPFRM